MSVLSISRMPVPEMADWSWEERRAYEALPSYPKFGATVAKYRQLPRTPENIKAHAEALFAQLRSIQRAEWKASLKAEPEAGDSPCASGTALSDGEAICKAVRRKHAAALASALAEDHKLRTDKQVGFALAAALAGEDYPGIVRHKFNFELPRQRRADW